MNEADTCRTLVTPNLQAAGWDSTPHVLSEQVTFTDGRIVVTGRKAWRRKGKRADYILRYRPDLPIAVVEAKADTEEAGAGLQQANELLVSVNLDLKSPNAAVGLAHLPPEQLVEDIMLKERRILEILEDIKRQLAEVKR